MFPYIVLEQRFERYRILKCLFKDICFCVRLSKGDGILSFGDLQGGNIKSLFVLQSL